MALVSHAHRLAVVFADRRDSGSCFEASMEALAMVGRQAGCGGSLAVSRFAFVAYSAGDPFKLPPENVKFAFGACALCGK